PALAEWSGELGRPLPADRAAARSATRRCRAAGERVRRMLWDPVAARLRDAQRAFVVPDGGLALVNLAALPVAGDRGLVETGPTLALLGAERDLIDAPAGNGAASGLLALGGIDYDAAHASPPLAALDGGAVAARDDATARVERSDRRGLPPCAAFDRL